MDYSNKDLSALDLMLYFHIHNLSVMSDPFLHWSSSELTIKCPLQRHNTTSDMSLQLATFLPYILTLYYQFMVFYQVHVLLQTKI